MIKTPFALAVLSLALFGGLSVAARADDLETTGLPRLALNPPASPIRNPHTHSIWSWFYTGSDAFAAPGNNPRGHIGGMSIAGAANSASFASAFSGQDASKTYGNTMAGGKVRDDIARIIRAAAAGGVLSKPDPRSSASDPDASNALSNLRNAPAHVRIRGTEIEIGAHMSLNMGIIGDMNRTGSDH